MSRQPKVVSDSTLTQEKSGRTYLATSFIHLLNRNKKEFKDKKFISFFAPLWDPANQAQLTWEKLSNTMITYSALYAHCNLQKKDIERIMKQKPGQGRDKEKKEFMLARMIITAYLDHKALRNPASAQFIVYLKNIDDPEAFSTSAKNKITTDRLIKEENKVNKKSDAKLNKSDVAVDLSGLSA